MSRSFALLLLSGPTVYPTGTTIYDPQRAWSGYTIFQTETREGAVLIDMNGNAVRSWKHIVGYPVTLLPGGHVMGASWLGKGKTLSQNVAIGALIFHYPTLGLPAHAIGMTLLAASTALTLWSGYLYFQDYFRVRAGGRQSGGGSA